MRLPNKLTGVRGFALSKIFNPARFPVPLGLYTLRISNVVERDDAIAAEGIDYESETLSKDLWANVPDTELPWDVIVDPGEVCWCGLTHHSNIETTVSRGIQHVWALPGHR